MFNNPSTIGKFWRGRVVVERDDLRGDNPGHVVKFTMNTDDEILVRVEFANGDCYNVAPGDLMAL